MNSSIKFNDLLSLAKPKKLCEIIGQDSVVFFIKNAVSFNMIPNAVIFYGKFGCGKTLISRLFALYASCNEENISLRPCYQCTSCSLVDIHEFNSANYTQVDNIRDLIQDAKIIPLNSKYKFYILDEFHMLSTKSFNALLKEIEDPNEFTKFIFITTDIQNIPETLISRCFLLNIKPLNELSLTSIIKTFINKAISITEIKNHLLCNEMPSDDIISRIANASDHSGRNAINLSIHYLLTLTLSESIRITKNDLLTFLRYASSKQEITTKEFVNYFAFLCKTYQVSYLEMHKLLIDRIEYGIKNAEYLNTHPQILIKIIEILIEGFIKTKVVECAYIWTLISIKLLF